MTMTPGDAARIVFETVAGPLVSPRAWAASESWGREQLVTMRLADLSERCAKAVERLREAGVAIGLAALCLVGCATPASIQVVAPGAGVRWDCPASVPRPTWAGAGPVGPGDVVVALPDGTHRQLADAWAIGRADWRVLNGYRVALETAFAECRAAVDAANRLNRAPAQP